MFLVYQNLEETIRISNRNFVARDCTELHEMARNCSRIVRNLAELRGIVSSLQGSQLHRSIIHLR